MTFSKSSSVDHRTYNHGFLKSNPGFVLMACLVGCFIGSNWNLEESLHQHQLQRLTSEVKATQPQFHVPQCQRPRFNSSYNGNLTEDELRERILPISFGVPEGRFDRARRDKLTKTRDFAHIVPGKSDTYIYETEDAYYDGYAEAYFGITMKKAGWDCMRHYEIIAAGSIPYFLDIDELPPKNMASFPVDIVKSAMNLPGVPSQDEVKQQMVNGSEGIRVNHDLFDTAKYDSLRKELVEYSLQHLTWKGVAANMLSMTQKHYPCLTSPKVLVVTTEDCEYQSCVVFGGLYEILGLENMSSLLGPKRPLFRSIQKPDWMYGGGFSYADAYNEFWNENEQRQLTIQRLEEGFFNMIVFMNGSSAYCDQNQYFPEALAQSQILHRYQREFNPLVVVVDGSDMGGCHHFFTWDKYPLHYHMNFVREYDNAVGQPEYPLQPPRPWSGCDDCSDERTKQS